MKTMNFKLLLFTKITSVVGANAIGFAMLLFIVDFTQSARLLGLVSALTGLPMLLIMPFGGLLADRLNKKAMIVLFDFLSALANVALLWLLATGSYTVTNIALLSIVKAIIGVMAGPVFLTTVPQVVNADDLVEANSAIKTVQAIGGVGGSVLGGVMYEIVGIQMIAGLAVVLYLASAVMDLFLKIPHEKRLSVVGMWETVAHDFKISFSYLKNENSFIWKFALLGTIFAFTLYPLFNVGLPFIVSTVFETSPLITFSVVGGAQILGGVLAKSLKKYLQIRFACLWLFTLAISCSLLIFVFWGNLSVGFRLFNISLGAIAIIDILWGVLFGAHLQKTVPTHLLGKVSSLFSMCSLTVATISILLTGYLMENAPLALVFSGLTVLILMVANRARQVIKGNVVREKKQISSDNRFF